MGRRQQLARTIGCLLEDARKLQFYIYISYFLDFLYIYNSLYQILSKVIAFFYFIFYKFKIDIFKISKYQAFSIYIFNKINLVFQPNTYLYLLSLYYIYSIISLRNQILKARLVLFSIPYILLLLYSYTNELASYIELLYYI